MRKVVIVTALDVEYKAVRAYLANVRGEMYRDTFYEKGIFETGQGQENWEVILVASGMGNTNAAVESEKALSYYQPSLVLFVGVAGGLKDVQPGDVVAGKKMYFYEAGRAEEYFKPRPEIKEPTRLIEQCARVIVRNNEWQQRIKGTRGTQAPKALLGIIAAGEKVVGSTKSESWRLLHQSYSDAQAVEMEGYGALLAAHTHTGIEALVIRGISDTLDNKGELDKQNFQDIASRHASAFAYALLAKLAEIAAETPASSAKRDFWQKEPQSIHFPPSDRNISTQKSSAVSSSPVQLFYSYMEGNQTDRKLIDELKEQLAALRWSKRIEEWDVSQIVPGANRIAVIRQHMQQADIFILGISSAYIASPHHYTIEMQGAMEAYRRGSATVIPVLLRPTAGLESLPISELLILPRGTQNGKPKVLNDSREAGLAEVAAEITRAVNELRKE